MSSERNVTWTTGQGRWKVRSVSYIVQKFHELWSTTGLKRDRTFYPPSLFYSSQSITHPLIGINVASDSDSKWNDIGFVCSSDSKPQKMLNWKCYRVGRP